MRKQIKFEQLTKRLDEELEKEADRFFKDRTFLEDKEAPLVIKEGRTDEEIEEKIANEITIKELIKELKTVV